MQAIERVINNNKRTARRLFSEALKRVMDLPVKQTSLHKKYPEEAQIIMESIDSLDKGEGRERAQRFYMENWLTPRPYTVRDLVRDVSSIIKR